MKRLVAFLLMLCCLFALVSCGGDEPAVTDSGSASLSGTDTATDTASGTDSNTEGGSGEEADAVPDLVMAHNAITGILGVYDFGQYEEGMSLEDCLVWSFKGGDGGDLKYREDSVFGDVILSLGGAVGGMMISYPEGKVLWNTKDPGNNPHSIELLPSGNIIIANSTGGTLRFFNTSALLEEDEAGAKKYHEYELTGAHGVLYDPEYGVVWALGDYELAAYRIVGSGTEEKLSKIDGMGLTLPTAHNGGHDLSPDYTSVGHLYLTTNSKVYRFDKENNELVEKFSQYAKLSDKAVKGFSNNANGHFFLSKVNYGIGTSWEGETFASWCTDRIHYAYWKTENFLYVQEIVSENGAFYKIRSFVGTYL